MALPTIYDGTDVDIQITLYDEAGDPLIISSTTGIIMWVVHKSTGTVLGQFSKNPLAGHGAISTIDDNGGIVQFKLTSDQTRDAPAGCLVCEIKVRITAATIYDSVDPIQIANLAPAFTKNVTTFS